MNLNSFFQFATSGSHFLFEGSFYDQIDEVGIGLSLGIVKANLFMGHYENKWLQDFVVKEVVFHKRCVDVIFAYSNQSMMMKFFCLFECATCEH